MPRTSVVSQWCVISVPVLTDIGCNKQMCFDKGNFLGDSVDSTIFDTTILQFCFDFQPIFSLYSEVKQIC